MSLQIYPSSVVIYRGLYNASTNSPDLDTSPSDIKKGDMYWVSNAGTFFTEALIAGDVLVSSQDDPTALSHWIRLRKTDHAAAHVDGTDDIQNATAAQKGLMTLAYAGKLDDIEAAADVTDETNVTTAFPISDATSLVKDPGDGTKQIRLDAGAITTSTVRVITMPDKDITLGTPTPIQISTLLSSQTPQTMSNLKRYVALLNASAADYIGFEIAVQEAGDYEIEVAYHMSAANAGNLYLTVSSLETNETDDPTTSLSADTPFTVAPGNDTNQHILNDDDDSSLAITVGAAGALTVKLERDGTHASDTHTGDMRITNVIVRKL